jgi:hypothetical protein
MDAGSWVEEQTGWRVLGAIAAADWAACGAISHAPEAAYDYAVETWTVDPDENRLAPHPTSYGYPTLATS